MVTERYMTKNMENFSNAEPEFGRFVFECFDRFENNDWGNVCDDDAEINSESPIDALGVYTFDNGIYEVDFWIKSDGYIDKRILTALFPDEY